MDLRRPDKPQSHKAEAILDADEFTAAGGDVDRFPRYCALVGDRVHVQISIASLEYLESVGARDRVKELVRALPFTAVNNRPRVQCWDFALAHGATTQTAVDAWLDRNRVRSRSTTLPTLKVPD